VSINLQSTFLRLTVLREVICRKAYRFLAALMIFGRQPILKGIGSREGEKS
jgi:hypothetical protein